jgi:hypothetical protein
LKYWIKASKNLDKEKLFISKVKDLLAFSALCGKDINIIVSTKKKTKIIAKLFMVSDVKNSMLLRYFMGY